MEAVIINLHITIQKFNDFIHWHLNFSSNPILDPFWLIEIFMRKYKNQKVITLDPIKYLYYNALHGGLYRE